MGMIKNTEWLENYIDQITDPLEFMMSDSKRGYLSFQALKRMRELSEQVEKALNGNYFCFASDLEKAKDVLPRAARAYMESKTRLHWDVRDFLDRLISEYGDEKDLQEPNLGVFTEENGVRKFKLTPKNMNELVEMASPKEVPLDAKVVMSIGGSSEVTCNLEDLECSFIW